MRLLVMAAVCAGLIVTAGCAKTKAKTATPTVPKTAASGNHKAGQTGQTVLVTPTAGISGKVASLNSAGQFVVVTFAASQMPARDQKLSVYRGGLKVGEVKVGEWQQGQNLVADLVKGEAKPGDEVRPE
ncbi:MAG: hypothetical protein NTW03_06765 [Verrucomicrobia bacterium]|nr:hypothetical protein [Verrucomicrobiota bacterium]